MTNERPRLDFALPHGWWRVDSRSVQGILDVYDEILRDPSVKLRHKPAFRRYVREQFTAMRGTGENWDELYLGSPLLPTRSMLLSLFVPSLHPVLSPARGHEANTVLQTLEASIGRVEPDAMQHVSRRPFLTGDTLRTVSFSEISTDDPELPIRVITATYWFPVPRSKRVVPAVFTSPFGLTPFTVLTYTDSLVRGTELVSGRRSSPAIPRVRSGYDGWRV